MNMLYRYFDVKGLEATVSTQSLRLAKIASLNDPFDFNPQIKLKEVDDEELREIYDNLSKQGLDISKMTLSDLRADWNLREAKFTPSMMRSLADRHFGTISFSKLYDCPLMWAHYAEKHRGANIGFHIEQSPFSDMKERDILVDVDYQVERPIFYHHPTDKAFFSTQFKSTMRIKGKVWDYENEIRAIIPTNNLGKIESRFFENEGYSYLRIRPNEWKEIRFGLYTEGSVVEKVMSLANEKGMHDCKFFKATLKKDKFQIEFESLA